MAAVLLIARHTMRPGTEDEVLPLVQRLTAATRAEPGNLAFDAYRSMDDPRSYVLLERYASPEALAAHRETRHFKEIVLDQLVPLLSARTLEELDAAQDAG
jgi:quinol monooxygenase YgiN